MTDTIAATYPIGSVWRHKSYGTEEFTIVGHNERADSLLLTYGDGTGPHTWPRAALDSYGTLVRLGVYAKIDTAEKWNDLPLGSILVDKDGWLHTKVANWGEGGPVDSTHTSTYRALDGQTGTFGAVWQWDAILVSTPTNNQEDTVSNTTTRPTIDFSGSSRTTARSYAADLTSRVNKPETNTILKQVAAGKQVDAYDLAEALLDASRHVATRFGQSLDRRRAGEKVAHLGYIAHGVLANHADSLPAYPTGDRSRRIADLEARITDLETEREDTKVALVQAREEVDAVLAALEFSKREVEDERDVNEALATSLGYALGVLAAVSEAGASQVLGFLDAHGLVLDVEGDEE